MPDPDSPPLPPPTPASGATVGHCTGLCGDLVRPALAPHPVLCHLTRTACSDCPNQALILLEQSLRCQCSWF